MYQYGKTVILLTVGLLQQGITLVLILLIGLRCDLVAKYTNLDRNIEALHLDEWKSRDDFVVL